MAAKPDSTPALDAYRKRVAPSVYVPAQTQAIKLLEQTLGKSLPQVKGDFMNWVPRVYDPNRRLYLGGIPVPKELPGSKVQSIPRELPDIKCGVRETRWFEITS